MARQTARGTAAGTTRAAVAANVSRTNQVPSVTARAAVASIAKGSIRASSGPRAASRAAETIRKPGIASTPSVATRAVFKRNSYPALPITAAPAGSTVAGRPSVASIAVVSICSSHARSQCLATRASEATRATVRAISTGSAIGAV
jgi:hypothetical protein